MTLTFPVFNHVNLMRSFRATFAKPAAEMITENDSLYAERDFLRELMARNPEAVQSDLGLMAMMTQYPRQF